MFMYMNMNHWITPELKQKISSIFMPRYRRDLTDIEIIEIADSLANVMELIIKTEWKVKNGKI